MTEDLLMKKLMVLGAPDFQIPLLKQARNMGVHTYVLDMNPHSRGAVYADDFYQCSLKDSKSVLDIARKIMPDGVTVGMCDVAVNSAAIVSKELGLPGLDVDTAQKATDKYLMIQEFEKFHVPHPWFKRMRIEDISALINDQNISYPFISKPIDMAGSRGINKIESRNDIESMLNDSIKASDNHEIIIEEFMEGPEVSVELLVLGHTPHVLQITDKYTSGAPHFVELGHTQPSSLPNSIKRAIEDVAQQAVRALGLFDCCAHAEIIVTKEGPKMVEIGARMGGDSIQQQLIMLSKGINMPYYSIKMALGEEVTLPNINQDLASTIRFLTCKKSGTVKNVCNVNEARRLDHIRQVEVYCQKGDAVAFPVDSSGRLGYVLSQADSTEESIAACEMAVDMIKILVED